MTLVSVVEASQILGVSTHTVKRHLKQGKLKGQQQDTPQGYIWMVDVAEGDSATAIGQSAAPIATAGEIRRLEYTVELLQQQIERHQKQVEGYEKELEARRREVQELHVLLQQSQAPLPAPKEHGGWWKRLWRR